MKRITTIAASAVLMVVASSIARPAAAVSGAGETAEAGVVATFEGQRFDMSLGWGTPDIRPEVQACHVTDTAADCYRSETEMNDAIDNPEATARAVNCATSLRMYDGTSHTGAVLSLTQRGSILSLSSFGFNNRTSSYRVGACSSTFYNGIGTSPYPGNTSAYASATSMYSGWNNTISSAYLS